MDYGRPTIADGLTALEFREPSGTAAAVYDRPIGLHLLYEDPDSGEEHYVVRYPSALRGHAHRHTASHTIIVIDGELEVNGRVIGPSSYAHFPADEVMRHQAAGGGPCHFVLMFHGPFDVTIVDDASDPVVDAAR
jgi:quercetin dioxygenase-like cupin family protein